MGYVGAGSGMLCTWSVLLPSLLHCPHTHPMVAAPYLLVMLLDTKVLEQQRRGLADTATANACFLIAYPSRPSTRRALWGVGIYSATRVYFLISLARRTETRNAVLVSIPFSIPFPFLCRPKFTDGLTHPLPATQRQALFAKTRVTVVPTPFSRSCGEDCNIGESSAGRHRGRLERPRRDKKHC